MRIVLPLALFALACPMFAQADAPAPVAIAAAPQVVVQVPATPPVAPVDAAATPAAPDAAPPATGDASSAALLTIPVPSNAKIVMEIDTRGDDILGVVKDFLSGYDAQTLVDSITSAQQLEPEIKAAMDGTWNPKAPATKPAKATLEPTILPDSIAHVSMADMLRNINHIHVVVLEISEIPAATAHAAKAAAKPKPVTGAAPLLPGEAASTPAANSVVLKNIVKYYETTYHSEGGNRIFWADFDMAKMIMIGFRNSRSSAIIFQMSDSVTVMRIDGYIDLKPLNILISAAMHQAVKTAK